MRWILYSLIFISQTSISSAANLYESQLYAECEQDGYRYEIQTREKSLSDVKEDSAVDIYQYESGKDTQFLGGVIGKNNSIELPPYWFQTTLDPENCVYQTSSSKSKNLVESKAKGKSKSGAILKVNMLLTFIPLGLDLTTLSYSEYEDYIADKTILLFRGYVYCELASATATAGACMKISMPDQEIYPVK